MQKKKINLQVLGYRDVFFSTGWRVSYSNYDFSVNDVSSISEMEKHYETDEVFFLIKGTAYLVIGGKGEQIENLEVQKLEEETLYIVEKGEWHVTVLQPGAALMIVENEAESLSKFDEINKKALEKLIKEAY